MAGAIPEEVPMEYLGLVVLVVVSGLGLGFVLNLKSASNSMFLLDESVEDMAVPMPVPVTFTKSIGSTVRFLSHAGKVLAAKVVAHDAERGYALQRRGHPNSAVFYRHF